LRRIESSGLVSHPQVGGAVRERVHGLARFDMEHEERPGRAIAGLHGEFRRSNSNGRRGVVESGLAEGIGLLRGDVLDLTIVKAHDDDAALGIGHGDEGDGEVLRGNSC